MTNPPVAVVDDSAGFYIRAQLNNRYTYITHERSAFTKPCMLAATDVAAGTKDIVCYVEGEELDLYFQGVSLQYNVPSSMCKYLEVNYPYYYLFPSGQGPALAWTSTDPSAPVPLTDIANSVAGVPYCAYDHGTRYPQSGAPNCCIGTYTNVQDTVSQGQLSSSSTPNNPWAGKISNCLAGPAMDNLPISSKTGFPESEIFFTDDIGANNVVNFKAPIQNNFASNIYVANFFYPDPTGTVPASHTSDTVANYNLTRLYPKAFNPAAWTAPSGVVFPDRPAFMGAVASVPASTGPNLPFFGAAPTGTYPVSNTMNSAAFVTKGGYVPNTFITNPFYSYSCLDRNHDLVARIRVLVRSWDVTGQITTISVNNDYGEAVAGTTDPVYAPTGPWNGAYVCSTTGCEPAPFGNQPLHDYGIWEDMKTMSAGNWAGYSTTTYETGYPGFSQ